MKDYLTDIQAIAERGFDVNELSAFCKWTRADDSDAPNAAIVYALTHYDEPTLVWWLAGLAAGRVAAGAPCTCSMAKGSPSSEPDLAVEGERVDTKSYTTTYDVRCKVCGARYKVREDTGYHYPTHRWTKDAGAT